MIGNAELRAVLSYYNLGEVAVRSITPLGNAGGWSGSQIWRLGLVGGAGSGAKGDGDLCLRRWPREHPTPDRLRLIHAVLRLVATDLPIVACPLPATSGATFVENGDHLWELTRWLPGAADYHANPTRPKLRAAMQLLARFHSLAGAYELRLGNAPAVAERRQRLQELREYELTNIERSLCTPLNNPIDERAIRLLRVAHAALEQRDFAGELASVPELWLAPAIRDIHHDHVLYIGDDVSGLIDFGALKIDTPLTDCARLIGSLVGDDRDARQFALDAYGNMRTLSEEDRRLIDLLDKSGVVIGALNWLLWLYVERRDMGPIEPVVRRLDELLTRLHNPAGDLDICR